MKKTITPAKLTLKLETVKTLEASDLPNIVGGRARPTTTVLPTGPC